MIINTESLLSGMNEAEKLAMHASFLVSTVLFVVKIVCRETFETRESIRHSRRVKISHKPEVK